MTSALSRDEKPEPTSIILRGLSLSKMANKARAINAQCTDEVSSPSSHHLVLVNTIIDTIIGIVFNMAIVWFAPELGNLEMKTSRFWPDNPA